MVLELSDIEFDFILDQLDKAWVNVEVTDHLICYTLRRVFKYVEVEACRAALCVPWHRVLNCNIDHVLRALLPLRIDDLLFIRGAR